MAYFVTLLRYIHQNPVKAGIVNKVYVMKQEPVPVFDQGRVQGQAPDEPSSAWGFVHVEI
jgi:hypothetical protein